VTPYRILPTSLGVVLIALMACTLTGCGGGTADAAAGAPPPAVVEHENSDSTFRVEKPERFPLFTAVTQNAASTLSVTGVVTPDVSRAVPVVSLTSGRVVDLRVRLGDQVRKGQLLLRLQSADATSALADYRKAEADDTLARTQLDRARELFERGAIARKDLEVAEDAAAKASVDLQNTTERLRVLGVKQTDSVTVGSIVDIVAPASGVITEQNVTPAAGIKTLDNSPNLFTISDLSRVWVLCDVNENDVPAVRVGDAADIRANAYPDQVLAGHVGNIGAVLDPTLRTAKVRVELPNPGFLRVGMFVTAAFHGQAKTPHVVVPGTAVLHLHDRDWVYLATGERTFERRAVVIGPTLSGNLQEVVSGLAAGQRVVANALELQTTVEQ
jgi:cobalt-zinc-cadmium efflux system membrane fusion protein